MLSSWIQTSTTPRASESKAWAWESLIMWKRTKLKAWPKWSISCLTSLIHALIGGEITLYPLDVSTYWQFDTQCLIFGRWPPSSCICVPPWTFRPHARHFRQKSCHVQGTVTFNSVSILKLPTTSSNPLNPHITYIVNHCGDLLAYFLSSPTPKQTVAAGEIRFRSPAIADNAIFWTVGDCYLKVRFFKELGNICNEATLLLRASGLCVNLVHRKKKVR
jgi:hypothetical protein